jgi:O-Antigen ligase
MPFARTLLRQKTDYLLLSIFPVYFYLSGFQGAVFLGDESFYFAGLVKKLLIATLLCLMFAWSVVCGLRKEISFFILPLFLLVSILTSSVLNDSKKELVDLFVRISFFSLLVFWFRSRGGYRTTYKWCVSWYSHKIVFWCCCALIVGFFCGPLRQDISVGFGSSRGTFGIWLVQLACLSFFTLSSNKSRDFLYTYFFAFLPIYALQCIVASRVGILAALILACYFFWVTQGRKHAVYCLFLSLSVAVTVSRVLGLMEFGDKAMDPLRYSEALLYVEKSMREFNFYLDFIDKYSSYRLTIISTAFANVQLVDLLFGLGGGEFKGEIPRYPHLGLYDVHNIFLKMLGEYGVFAFISLSAIVMNGVYAAYRCGRKGGNWNVFVVQLIYLLMSMLHPDLLLTAVSTSLIYIFTYAMASNEARRC